MASVQARSVILPCLMSSGLLAFFALAPATSWLPLSAFVASLVSLIVVLQKSSGNRAIFVIGAIGLQALGTSLARLGPSVEALSTPAISLLLLFAGSAASIALSWIPLYLWVLVASWPGSPLAKVMLFPAIWATSQTVASHFSPLGRLMVWTPIHGIDNFRWLLPIFGVSVLDWVVGLAVILIIQVAESANWIPPTLTKSYEIHKTALTVPYHDGSSLLEWPDEEVIPRDSLDAQIAHSDDTQLPESTSHLDGPSVRPRWNRAGLSFRLESILTAALLAFLVTPPIIAPLAFNVYPVAPQEPGLTPVSIACIMPTINPSTSSKNIHEIYHAETKQYASRAAIHVWPESAVRFDTQRERADYLEQLRVVAATSGIWIAVGFDDFAPRQDTHSREGMRRNGIVLVGRNGPEFEYLKQNLVPSKCFISITGSETR